MTPVPVVDGERACAGVTHDRGTWRIYWLVGLRREYTDLEFATPRKACLAARELKEE